MRVEDFKGEWALVTGASSGIGREFAIQLATAGMNLALVARREDRLRSLADTLARRNRTNTVVLPMDVGQEGAVQLIRQHMRQRDIAIRLLCNSAALGAWTRFEGRQAPQYEEVIRVNAMALVSMCREFFPDLASHASAAIINVSSPAAYQPVPYMAVYAATKAFVHAFSQALYGEVVDGRVLVQTLVPGPTRTELEGADAVPGKYCAVEDVVRKSLAALKTGRPVVVARRGAVMQRLFALLPTGLVVRQVARMFEPPRA